MANELIGSSLIGGSLIGGSLIGEGTYGCIFDTPLKCKNKVGELDKNVLHKLISKDEALDEFNITKIIRTIPLWRNYFAVAESICIPSPAQDDPELLKCSQFKEYKLSEMRILSMRHGGYTSDMFRFPLYEFNIMSFFIHLLEGCSLLTLKGIVHNDIHSRNIVIDKYNVPRFIDFNLSLNIFNYVEFNLKYSLKYKQQTPDFLLINAIALRDDYESVIQDIVYKRSVNKKIRNLLNYTNNEMVADLNECYMKIDSFKKGDIHKWFKYYWRKIDTWAIVVYIIEIILKLSIYPVFVHSFSKYKDTIKSVLKKMCHFNPDKRIDAIQALHILKPDSFIIKKYGEKWLKDII